MALLLRLAAAADGVDEATDLLDLIVVTVWAVTAGPLSPPPTFAVVAVVDIVVVVVVAIIGGGLLDKFLDDPAVAATLLTMPVALLAALSMCEPACKQFDDGDDDDDDDDVFRRLVV